jgi:uncharacterized protein YdaU (DUF1376 family)
MSTLKQLLNDLCSNQKKNRQIFEATCESFFSENKYWASLRAERELKSLGCDLSREGKGYAQSENKGKKD